MRFLTKLWLALILTWVPILTLKASEQTSSFVGSVQCSQCHAKAYAVWQESDHHKAMQPASKNTVLGDFDNVTVNFHGIETRFSVSPSSIR
jgi:hypothetical protein